MTFATTALRGLAYYKRTYGAVACGVASAVAVLAGAWLVGHSVTRSLADLVERRLGRTGVVVTAETPFTETLAAKLEAAPLIALEGLAEMQGGARAGQVQVYGVDERFFGFHRLAVEPPRDADVFLSPDLAAELGASVNDTVIVRVARPTDIPLDSLHGRKDDVGRTMRVRVRRVLDAASMGEFSLAPRQGPVRAVFVALPRLQRDLALTGRINTALLPERFGVGAGAVTASVGARMEAADIGLKTSPAGTGRTIVVEAASGLLSDALGAAVPEAAAHESLGVTPVLTWLATRISAGTATVPYSLVAAIGPEIPEDPALASLLQPRPESDPPIVLNDWTAQDLGVTIGESIEMEFYRWTPEDRLATDRARFRLAGILPIRGLTADTRLAPEYPGITETKRVADWDPPFPIDLRQVRPQDETYWERYRATPKAFIPLEVGQRLWGTRHGQLTSVRVGPAAADVDLASVADHLRANTVRHLDATAAGFTVVDVRRAQQSASAGATDFGAYFSYFSFFIVVSALLLAGLFFRLSIEQRLSQIGVLRSAGFSLGAVRRVFLLEGAVVILIGSVLGVGLAIGWAWLMMYGLRTWWIDAVGTTRLSLVLDLPALAIGAAGGAIAGFVAILITIRGLSRTSPRQLLTGSMAPTLAKAGGRARLVALFAFAAALGLTVLAFTRVVPAAAAFFGAGAFALIGGLAALAAWIRRPASAEAGASRSLVALGMRNTSWRPGRSLTSAGLVAAAVFLLVSVDAFRKAPETATDPKSGTGGFALIAESALPLVNNPATREGQEALNLVTGSKDMALTGVTLTALRLRPGDDASCLNLYQPKRPRIVGVPASFVNANRFRFAASSLTARGAPPPLARPPALPESLSSGENPWTLLGPAAADGVVPAIADQTSLQYVLHASVGQVIEIDADSAKPRRLRIVAALADSVLQGELLIAEEAFRAMFPEIPGYRMILAEVSPASPERIDAVSRTLEERLEPYGVDAQETTRRLEAYHRVENTYLSTFQALGGLGLVLGMVGLAAVIARNVLERRRELALLGAVGFTGRDLRSVVAIEQLSLLAAGVVIGLAAALIAVAPVKIARGGGIPALSFLWIAGVVVAGIVATLWATRHVQRLPLVESLRAE